MTTIPFGEYAQVATALASRPAGFEARDLTALTGLTHDRAVAVLVAMHGRGEAHESGGTWRRGAGPPKAPDEPERPRVTRDNGSGFTGAHQRRQFTARFRRAVDRTKCTRGALADAAGVSKAMVAVWYGGTSAPLRDRLPALAEALGCSAAWLALETDEPGWRKGTVVP